MFGFISALQLKTHCLWHWRQPLKNTDVYFLKSKSIKVWMLVGSEWDKHWTTATNDPPHCAQLHTSGGVVGYNVHGKGNRLKTTQLTAANGTDRPQIISMLYCKMFSLCSTRGMAMASTMFTTPTCHKPTIKLTRSVSQSSAAVLIGKTG